MKHWHRGSVAFVGLAVAFTASAQETRHRTTLHRAKLDNGLEILVVENHAAPIATVLIAVRGGASAQLKAQEGLAHLFEHLLFRVYEKDPGAFDVATADLAGINQGATEIESVYYYLVLPSKNTEEGIRLLGRLITRATFSQFDLEAERLVVLDELERGRSDPDQELARKVSRALWGEAWHRRDIAGDSVSLMRITLDQLTATYSQFYVPNNAALIVTGDVLPTEIFDAAQQHLGDWEQQADPFDGREFDALEPLTDSQALMLSRAVPDVTVRIAMQGPKIQDDIGATYAAYALLEVINDPRSKFQRRLVGSGVFQSLEGSYFVLSDVGLITIQGKTTAAAAHQALPALLVQIDSLEFIVGVTNEDLDILKKRREVDAAIALEGTAALAPSLASWWAGAGLDYYITRGEGTNALTLDDLRKFARQYLAERPKVIGMLGPGAAINPITEWLRGISKSP